MIDCVTEYYRCPDECIRFEAKGPLSEESGYFQFGEGAICYGGYTGHRVAKCPSERLHDALLDVEAKGETILLPFDPSQVVRNLQSETYVGDWRNREPVSLLARMYYFVRPLLPLELRRHLQRTYLRGWEQLPFPRWPVDCSVDTLLQQLLLLSVRSSHAERIPFIWFWPDGAPASAIMTHDVETEFGRKSCAQLIDLDDSYGIKASFQIVPEERYSVKPDFLNAIRERGFEVVVHDLNHDGHLYRNRKQFLERTAKINAYGKAYGAEGFRAGVLYRKQLWYDALDFAYDMSVPNVAHLDPQRGGCCTVMPYFLGNILELPVTTTQDYTLFNILKDYSIELWKRQIDGIMASHGLMSFIVHPDYVTEPRERGVYKLLLAHLVQLRRDLGIWITTPGEVNRWWRQRAQMTLVEQPNGWEIDGPGRERARVAYASERDGQLVFTLQETDQQVQSVSRLPSAER